MWDFIVQYWMEFALGVLASGITIAFKILFGRIKKWKDEQDCVKEGVIALLYIRIYDECQRLIERGYVTETDLRNIECLYKAYHELGGNGTGTELYERVMDLPLKRE